MSEMKHTPGPWKLGPRGITITDKEGFVLCNLTIFNQQEANARLIVAAPDLLEALVALVEQVAFEWRIYDLMNIDDEMAAARTAIAKATGEDES